MAPKVSIAKGFPRLWEEKGLALPSFPALFALEKQCTKANW